MIPPRSTISRNRKLRPENFVRKIRRFTRGIDVSPHPLAPPGRQLFGGHLQHMIPPHPLAGAAPPAARRQPLERPNEGPDRDPAPHHVQAQPLRLQGQAPFPPFAGAPPQRPVGRQASLRRRAVDPNLLRQGRNRGLRLIRHSYQPLRVRSYSSGGTSYTTSKY